MQLAAKAIVDWVKRAQATGKKIKSAMNWRQRDRPRRKGRGMNVFQSTDSAIFVRLVPGIKKR